MANNCIGESPKFSRNAINIKELANAVKYGTSSDQLSSETSRERIANRTRPGTS
jgi:hypothetical protein